MIPFQQAAKAVVEGELAELRRVLDLHPDLVRERSADHGATLLHYVGANGPVEEALQKTPPNAVEIARLLIEHGAVVDAIIDNQPASTPLVSLVTSEFPAAAGLQGQLVELFVQAGAAVNGLQDDGYPLACALCFQYEDAIQALLECGARVDNVVAAAATGKLGFVEGCFDSTGQLLPDRAFYPEPFQRSFSPAEVLQTALEHARHFKQQEVVVFLETRVKFD